MLRILFIVILVALYYFSTFTYKSDMASKELFVKESSSWSGTTIKEEEYKDEYYLSWFLAFGVKHPNKDNMARASVIELSYIKK